MKARTPTITNTWARFWAVARPKNGSMIRRGAWYPVKDDHELVKIVLDVRGHSVAVPRRLVELRHNRPDRFTVVCRARDEFNPAAGTASDLGHVYAVCPISASRVRLFGEPMVIQCPDCGHKGEVAWWETG